MSYVKGATEYSIPLSSSQVQDVEETPKKNDTDIIFSAQKGVVLRAAFAPMKSVKPKETCSLV